MFMMRLPLLLAALALVAPAPVRSAAPPQAEEPRFPDADDVELLAAAGLAPPTRGGDLIRYMVRRDLGYERATGRARIVQAEWRYGVPYPRALLIELEEVDGAWKVTRKREALMQPGRYNQLVGNVAAVAAVVGDRSNRGTRRGCSHCNLSRLDMLLPDEQGLHLSRSSRSYGDSPAGAAGELLTAAVERALSLNWSPE